MLSEPLHWFIIYYGLNIYSLFWQDSVILLTLKRIILSMFIMVMFLFPVNVLSWWCFCFQLMFYHGDVSVSSFCLSWWCFCFQLMFYHNDVSVSSQCLSWWCFLKRSLLIDLSLQPNFSHLILSPLSLLPTHFFQQIFSSSFTLFGKSSDPPHIHVATNYRQKSREKLAFVQIQLKWKANPF